MGNLRLPSAMVVSTVHLIRPENFGLASLLENSMAGFGEAE